MTLMLTTTFDDNDYDGNNNKKNLAAFQIYFSLFSLVDLFIYLSW